jgi:hypothetical protein
MRILFDELAKKELNDAIEYYEIEFVGLGQKFKEEIKRILGIVKEMQRIGSVEKRRYQKIYPS